MQTHAYIPVIGSGSMYNVMCVGHVKRDLLDMIIDSNADTRILNFDDPISAIQGIKLMKSGVVICNESIELIEAIQFLKICKSINSIITILYLNQFDEDKVYKALVEGIDLILDGAIYSKINHLCLERSFNSISPISTDKYTSLEYDIALNDTTFVVYQKDKEINFTYKEFQILKFLLTNKNNVFSREEIINQIWDVHYESIDPRTVDVHIRRIREKLDNNGIVTIRSVGYKWVENP